LLENGSANTSVTRQWLNSRHVIAVTDTHAIVMEETFSVRSVPRLYNEDQLPLRGSFETAVTKLGGWCNISAGNAVTIYMFDVFRGY
jgi:hypothetical protein